ncbi:MAG: CDP-alcohol phosphatidyltransferase family protein [Gemmatimonadota bacterium]
MKAERLPDLITRIRLLAIPVLWLFALTGRSLTVGVGLSVVWATDAIDGFLARRLGVESDRGRRLDSIADAVMFLSAMIWVAMLRPAFIADHRVLLVVWLTIGTVSYIVSWIRFRQVPSGHLLSAKAANFVGFLFIPYLIAFGTYAGAVAWAVMAVWLLAAIETLFAVVTLERMEGRKHMVGEIRRRLFRERGGEGRR